MRLWVIFVKINHKPFLLISALITTAILWTFLLRLAKMKRRTGTASMLPRAGCAEEGWGSANYATVAVASPSAEKRDSAGHAGNAKPVNFSRAFYRAAAFLL